MEKVVKTGLKFDLHIHSVVSAHKDGIKVKNNTVPLQIMITFHTKCTGD